MRVIYALALLFLASCVTSGADMPEKKALDPATILSIVCDTAARDGEGYLAAKNEIIGMGDEVLPVLDDIVSGKMPLPDSWKEDIAWLPRNFAEVCRLQIKNNAKYEEMDLLLSKTVKVLAWFQKGYEHKDLQERSIYLSRLGKPGLPFLIEALLRRNVFYDVRSKKPSRSRQEREKEEDPSWDIGTGRGGSWHDLFQKSNTEITWAKVAPQNEGSARIIRDTAWDVCAVALATIGGDKSLKALLFSLRDVGHTSSREDLLRARACAYALELMKSKNATETLGNALIHDTSTNGIVGGPAAKALAASGDARAIPFLTKSSLPEASRALGEFVKSEEAVRELVRRTKKADEAAGEVLLVKKPDEAFHAFLAAVEAKNYARWSDAEIALSLCEQTEEVKDIRDKLQRLIYPHRSGLVSITRLPKKSDVEWKVKFWREAMKSPLIEVQDAAGKLLKGDPDPNP